MKKIIVASFLLGGLAISAAQADLVFLMEDLNDAFRAVKRERTEMRADEFIAQCKLVEGYEPRNFPPEQQVLFKEFSKDLLVLCMELKTVLGDDVLFRAKVKEINANKKEAHDALASAYGGKRPSTRHY